MFITFLKYKCDVCTDPIKRENTSEAVLGFIVSVVCCDASKCENAAGCEISQLLFLSFSLPIFGDLYTNKLS